MTTFQVSHVYLTLDDAGNPAVDTDVVIVQSADDLPTEVAALLNTLHPRLWATVSLTIVPLVSTRITL